MPVKRVIIHLLSMIIVLSAMRAAPAAELMKDKLMTTKIFYSQTDVKGWKAVIRGKALSFSVQSELDKNDLLDRLRDKSTITVRLYGQEGLKVGDELFVINGKNLVTARIKITRIFRSRSFGDMLTGNGSFRQCAVNDRVVQRLSDEFSRYAYINKARGDYFVENGESGKAIAEYKKALELDSGNPEAHLALGYIYLKQGLLQFAFREFSESYKRMGRLYDNEDRYLLLRGLAEIRFREVYDSYLPETARNKYREEGVGYCREALAIYPDSIDINYFLGRFHFKKSAMPEPEDRTARDYFLKVLEQNPEHVEANIALSELYFKHKNREKARFYAEQALKGDPASARARQLMIYIDRYNQ